MGAGPASDRSIGPADLRAKAQDHGGREADLEEVTGERTARTRRGTRARGRRPATASCATPPTWMTTMPSAQASSTRRMPADRADERPDHAGRHRKREQIAARGARAGGPRPRRHRRTPAGPPCPSARYVTSAPTPPAAPSRPPTASTASGWRVIGTGLNGTGTATCAAAATSSAPTAISISRRPRRDARRPLGAAGHSMRGCHQTSSTLSATALPPPRHRVASPVVPPRSRRA